MTRHARIELLVAVGLALGSCSGDGPRFHTRDEIVDIADDVASEAIDDSDKVRELEGRLEALEQKLGL